LGKANSQALPVGESWFPAILRRLILLLAKTLPKSAAEIGLCKL
jgi:hypothetical protein